jgi:hypothetical protein
VLEHKKTELQK